MLIETTYFYTPPNNFSSGKVFLDEEETHHLSDVLRAVSGDEFFVANGIGQLFRCRLDKVHSKGAVAEIVAEVQPTPQPSIDITLALGIVRQKEMELALDWAVQIGIFQFAPIAMKYSKHKLSSVSKYFERLEKVSMRAMKQSKRALLVPIFKPMGIDEFLKLYGNHYDGILFADADGVPSVPKRMTIAGEKIVIIIGPEGGLSTSEKAELSEYGAVPLSLGESRIRAETAAVVAITKLLVWSGNI